MAPSGLTDKHKLLSQEPAPFMVLSWSTSQVCPSPALQTHPYSIKCPFWWLSPGKLTVILQSHWLSFTFPRGPSLNIHSCPSWEGPEHILPHVPTIPWIFPLYNTSANIITIICTSSGLIPKSFKTNSNPDAEEALWDQDSALFIPVSPVSRMKKAFSKVSLNDQKKGGLNLCKQNWPVLLGPEAPLTWACSV